MSDRDAISTHILAILHTVTGAVWMHDGSVVARTSATFTERDGLVTGEFPNDRAVIDRVDFVDDAGEVIYVASVHIDDASGVTFSTGSVTVTGT